MSVFTNPAFRSAEQAKAYTSAVIGLVEGKDPLEVLKATATELAGHANGLSHEVLTRPESEGKWSILQVLHHLADSEIVWSYRIRVVLAQGRPKLSGYDQDLWATQLRYNESSVEEALERFRVLRQSNLGLLARLSEEDVKRVGIHEERGEESIEFMILLCAGHDILHLRQIGRIKRAIL